MNLSNKILATNIVSFYKVDYLLVFLLLQINWFSILLNIPRLEFSLVLLVLIIYLQRNQLISFDKTFIAIFFIYTTLAVIQGIRWEFSIISLLSSFVYGFFLPYYLFKIYKNTFFTILEKVIRVLTIIALIIWILHQISPDAREIIIKLITFMNQLRVEEWTRSMLFYTYWPDLDQGFGLTRNAGFTYEPGAFSLFSLLAIIINYNQGLHLLHKRNLLYYFALLTTFSTAGYISLFVLSLLFLKQRRSRILGIFLFSLILIASFFIYRNAYFLQSKIEYQIKDQTGKELNESTTGRIYGARKSLLVLQNYPAFGRGLLSVSKPSDPSDPEYADYGWLSQIARFGIFLGLIFMFLFFRGIYRYIRMGGLGSYEFYVILTVIMIQLSAQVFITHPIFMVFFFMGTYNRIKKGNYHLNILDGTIKETQLPKIKQIPFNNF